MINRRTFLNTLSASALLSVVPAAAAQPYTELAVSTSRSRISLNEEWDHFVDGQFYGTITVPCSRRPSGVYSLHRDFVLPRLGRRDRAFVHLEGVTYWGQVSVNGLTLGTMNPYVPHEFEFTKIAREDEN